MTKPTIKQVWKDGIQQWEVSHGGMTRYFKNDWQGVLTGDGIDKKGRVLGVRVYGLDCRHTVDNLEKIFNDAEGRGY